MTPREASLNEVSQRASKEKEIIMESKFYG